MGAGAAPGPGRPKPRAATASRLPAGRPRGTARPRGPRQRPGPRNLIFALGRTHVSTALAGQRVGIEEVDDSIWIVSLTGHDLGYIDLEQKTLQPLDNPFGPRLSPMS